MGHQPCRKPPVIWLMEEVGKLQLSQCVQWWVKWQISPNNFSRAIIISGTHLCARHGSRPWRPAPNVVSIMQGTLRRCCGQGNHWNALNVLLQKSLTHLDLLEAGGRTQWFSESPANNILLQILGAMRVQSIVLEVLIPCLPPAAWLHLMDW